MFFSVQKNEQSILVLPYKETIGRLIMSHSLLSFAITWLNGEVNQQCYQAAFPNLLELHPCLKRHRHLKDSLDKLRKSPKILFSVRQGQAMDIRVFTGRMMLVQFVMALTVCPGDSTAIQMVMG